MTEEFGRKLADLLNIESIDNDLNIPDWILANYLIDSLTTLAKMESYKKERGRGKDESIKLRSDRNSTSV